MSHTIFHVILPPFAYAAYVDFITSHIKCDLLGPLKTDAVHRLHNCALGLYSSAVAVCVLSHVGRHGASVCGDTKPLPTWIITTWYWSKLWEWFDTFILVTRGRKVSHLHYYHHMITASITGLQTYGMTDDSHTPLYEVGTGLNALVHTFMYAYYAFPRFWYPVRAWITRFQILQHLIMVLGIIFSVTQSLVDRCKVDASGNVFPLLGYAFFLLEFSQLPRDAQSSHAGRLKQL